MHNRQYPYVYTPSKLEAEMPRLRRITEVHKQFALASVPQGRQVQARQEMDNKPSLLLQLQAHNWYLPNGVSHKDPSVITDTDSSGSALLCDVPRARVHGHNWPRGTASEQEVRSFLSLLRLPNETETEFDALFKDLKKFWSQGLTNGIAEIIEDRIAAADRLLIKNSDINIYRNSQTGTVYIEVELYNLRIKDTRATDSSEIALPGAMRYRFKLTPQDRQAQKGFCFDSMELSNSLLQDICFDPTWTLEQLQQRIPIVEQEEQDDTVRRQLALELATLEASAEDLRLSSSVRATSRNLQHDLSAASKKQDADFVWLTQSAQACSQVNEKAVNVLQRYTPEILQAQMAGQEKDQWNLGLCLLQEQAWHCRVDDSEHCDYILVGDVRRQTRVTDDVCHCSSDIEGEQFIRQRLRRTGEDDQQFDAYFAALKRNYNQSLSSCFRVFMEVTHLTGLNVVAEIGRAEPQSKTNIYRDPETGDTYIETEIFDIRYKNISTNQVITIPGTLRYRYKLTLADIQSGKGFRLDYVAPSNSLLRDLCFKPGESFTLETLTSRITQAQQEEYEASRRRFYRELAELETVVEDSNVDPLLRRHGKAVLAGLKQFKGEKAADYATLAEVAQATQQMVREPLRSDYARYLQLSERVPTRRSKGKILVGAMLVLLGVVLVAAAIALAVTTAGIGTPLSAVVAAIGVKVAIAGAVAAGVVGVAAAAGGGASLFSGQKAQPRRAMEDLANTSRTMRA
ncbi:MAG: hypothetical protein A3E83_07325 [Gammaproteobacteria bacterium RIFCSPHIGHO2_12_FULL_41_20]|nr:MAG: hypothetical protein A3E83_07325 [Gammaproteobacteria bacterium RIFCSPHIGHO2_12_FULL_41_20]